MKVAFSPPLPWCQLGQGGLFQRRRPPASPPPQFLAPYAVHLWKLVLKTALAKSNWQNKLGLHQAAQPNIFIGKNQKCYTSSRDLFEDTQHIRDTERKRRGKKREETHHTAGFEPTICWSWGLQSTAVPLLLPWKVFKYLHETRHFWTGFWRTYLVWIPPVNIAYRDFKVFGSHG